MSVMVPLVEFPFSTTEAPIIVSPFLSFTTPFTEKFCADTLSDIIATRSVSRLTRVVFIFLDIFI